MVIPNVTAQEVEAIKSIITSVGEVVFFVAVTYVSVKAKIDAAILKARVDNVEKRQDRHGAVIHAMKGGVKQDDSKAD